MTDTTQNITQRPPILRLSHISKSFGDRLILDDISLTLHKGELVSLLGISGSGKTTLFNIISGLLPPDSGQVLLNKNLLNKSLQNKDLPDTKTGNAAKESADYNNFDFVDITGQPGHISYMLQKDLLLPYRTIADNVALPLLLRGMDKYTARHNAAALFADFGLAGAENLYPAQLSGGMRQRAALLRTYLFSRDVALLDEPFSALDTLTKSAVHDWYLNVMKKIRLSTFFITHDIDEAILLSDRICLLSGHPGRITAEITIMPPRPRTPDFILSSEFVAYKRQILSYLK